MGRKKDLEVRMLVMHRLDDPRSSYGLVDANGKVEKNIDNKVASFLTAVYDMGVKPAVSRYSRERGELNGKPIMDFIFSVMNPVNPRNNNLLSYISGLQGQELIIARKQIIRIGVAMKYILRTYPERNAEGRN